MASLSSSKHIIILGDGPLDAMGGFVRDLSRPTHLWKPFLYIGYLLLVSAICLEIGVRVWGFSARHIYDPIYRPYELSSDIPYIHKPNLVHARARGLAVINTDSMGLRAKNSGTVYGPKQPHEYRIAIVGDSVTFGEGVTRTDDTYAHVLETLLNQRQHDLTVQVFNFGASAYSVKQMSATLQYRMMEIQPDLVIMAIIPSDFNLSRTPAIDRKGYLVDQRISVLLDSPIRDVLRGIHLMYVIREMGVRWVFPSENISSHLVQDKIPDSYRYIRQFKERADQFGVPHVIVLLPRTGGGVWGVLPAYLLQDGVRYLDLSFLGQEFSREEYMASRFDPHASPAVHYRIGESLAEYIRKQMRPLL